ncbi:hypothetical protein Tco_0678245 [Tanacetum coccineum]|uniref:Uncharacterized protein n=1 Tax=Tanacetum coccineum TaxID=301880 RepID=A0ABQ4XEQ3_9ASTR
MERALIFCFPLVRSSYVDHGGDGKGGSWVLTPDLVVMAKVGALVLDIFFNLIPPLFFGEKVEAELSKLVEFPTVVLGYVIVKYLYQKPFLGILSNHSAAFPLRERWKKRSLDASLVVPSAWVGGLDPMLLEVDASSSKRFLPAIARDSFSCKRQVVLLSL